MPPQSPPPPPAVHPTCRVPRLLEGQVAIVTGASSGIGRSIALTLGAAGAAVVVNWRSREDQAHEVVRHIESEGGQALPLRADVSQEDDVLQMFRRASDELGAIDILVANAGVQQDAPFAEMTLEQWQKVIDVNLTGQFLCAREAVRTFCRQGVRENVSCAAGKILCISSVHEIIPWAGHVNYAASKGGISLMMKSIAQEVAPWRIRVNSLAPGAIQTEINRDEWESEEGRQKMLELIPYRRIGVPDDVGRVAAWLLSDQADYITGETLVVDGGMALYPGFRGGG